MSAPRTKRQFAGSASDPSQRQITSFFCTSDSLNSSSASAGIEASLSSRPVLPADTQSHLLNVGMRVRKSVPEGYKTGSYSAFSLWSDNDATNMKNMATPPPALVRAPSSATGQRELLPFCGINKVGGLSSQPASGSDAPTVTVPRLQVGSVPSIDDVPSLTSSQGSIDSNASHSALTINTASTASRKRVYSEDEDSDTPSVTDSLQVPGGAWMDGEVSPRSLVPVGWDNTNTRIMAIPKKKRRAHKARAGTAPEADVAGVGGAAALPLHLDQLGQENMMAVDGDFQEAEFLDYKALAHDAMDI
ncbi:putative ribonucleotide reductase inhibitor [Diaporthe ampelina]|uniref:Putative ribonucleotide reductase inhibitor n=1 Tax=Diaporthe ampelina TaxID=1214573 RepID=A0A0G2FNZ4_9PEZI|nr:putative ribonucleotide reductase inhibitor [Diaporthe ampelina]